MRGTGGLLRLAYLGLGGAPLGGNVISIKGGHGLALGHMVTFVRDQAGQPATDLGGHIHLGGL